MTTYEVGVKIEIESGGTLIYHVEANSAIQAKDTYKTKGKLIEYAENSEPCEETDIGWVREL